MDYRLPASSTILAFVFVRLIAGIEFACRLLHCDVCSLRSGLYACSLDYDTSATISKCRDAMLDRVNSAATKALIVGNEARDRGGEDCVEFLRSAFSGRHMTKRKRVSSYLHRNNAMVGSSSALDRTCNREIWARGSVQIENDHLHFLRNRNPARNAHSLRKRS